MRTYAMVRDAPPSCEVLGEIGGVGPGRRPSRGGSGDAGESGSPGERMPAQGEVSPEGAPPSAASPRLSTLPSVTVRLAVSPVPSHSTGGSAPPMPPRQLAQPEPQPEPQQDARAHA